MLPATIVRLVGYVVLGLLFALLFPFMWAKDRWDQQHPRTSHKPEKEYREEKEGMDIPSHIAEFFSKPAVRLACKIVVWSIMGAIVLFLLVLLAIHFLEGIRAIWDALVAAGVFFADHWVRILIYTGLVVGGGLCMVALAELLTFLGKKRKEKELPREEKAPGKISRAVSFFITGVVAVKQNTCPRIKLK